MEIQVKFYVLKSIKSTNFPDYLLPKILFRLVWTDRNLNNKIFFNKKTKGLK